MNPQILTNSLKNSTKLYTLIKRLDLNKNTRNKFTNTILTKELGFNVTGTLSKEQQYKLRQAKALLSVAIMKEKALEKRFTNYIGRRLNVAEAKDSLKPYELPQELKIIEPPAAFAQGNENIVPPPKEFAGETYNV